MAESAYYRSDSQRAEKVRQLFSRIASRYNLMNDLMSFGLHRFWKRKVVAAVYDRRRPLIRATGDTHRVPLQTPLQVLDVCCGTGDIAFAFAAHGAQVVGLDFAEPMLAIARDRLGASTLQRFNAVTFIRGDALCLPFGDKRFDAVTIGYGLRNLADFEKGLRELIRVTRAGGRILILDFGKPDHKLWRWIYLAWLRFVVPLLGWLFSGNREAYRYILASLERYPAQRGIEKLMYHAGYTNIRVIDLLGGVSSIHIGERS